MQNFGISYIKNRVVVLPGVDLWQMWGHDFVRVFFSCGESNTGVESSYQVVILILLLIHKRAWGQIRRDSTRDERAEAIS